MIDMERSLAWKETLVSLRFPAIQTFIVIGSFFLHCPGVFSRIKKRRIALKSLELSRLSVFFVHELLVARVDFIKFFVEGGIFYFPGVGMLGLFIEI